MASFNLGSFTSNFFNWFEKPPNPISLPNLLSLTLSPKPLFSSLSLSPNSPPKPSENPSTYHQQLLEQYFWECDNLPDFRHTPEIEKAMKEDPFFETKENPTEEELEENKRWWEEFRKHPYVEFLIRAEEIADMVNEMELKANENPYRSENKKLWKSVPHIPGLDGRPMVRKAIKSKRQTEAKFWDFARQFFFGLWGFRQRPYPRGRPIDAAQAIGYNRLEKRYYDFIMKSGGWFYKDRLGRSRGPCELIQLKTAWGAGIIDTDTFIWGEDMDEWAPIGMVYGLEPAIATWEVKFGAAATAFLHKLQNGMSPWVPLKGHEKKTYKQLQEEAIESKKRDVAVLEANDGVWPGCRAPSHTLFLWASGSELTTLLEEDHMPNKFIPKHLRQQLAKAIPGLRPWEVLSVEQAMDQLTYGGAWYRKPLGTYTTGPPYLRRWNKDVKRRLKLLNAISNRIYLRLARMIPGFDKVVEQVQKDASEKRKAKARLPKRKAKRKAKETGKYGRSRRP